jgi:putative transposase
MRMARIKIRGRTAVYHCISRIVGGQRLLDDLGKEKLRQYIGQQAQFCGIQVLTYCVMSNHLHLLVEDQPGPLSEVAAYIDLNPVRAGLVSDPKDYRWSGYGEAMGGSAQARAGLCLVEHRKNWKEAAASYRKLLYLKAAQPGHSDKRALDPQAIRKVIEKGGEVSKAQALRLRIRYFTDGVALGSEAFVQEVFTQFRDRFGPKRRSGPRKLSGLPFASLRTCRALRVGAYG